jgi:ABC-type dipeptide/oligopeptide/nickel transport system permease subunit
MALSTPASATRSAGASTAPSETSPQEGLRGRSPRSEAAASSPKGTSLWRDGVRRFRRNRLAMAGGAVVAMLCLVAIFADVLAPRPYTKTNFGRLNEPPSRDYPLGTDALGRDLLSRMIYGARVSMLVGLGAQVFVVLIGVPF